MYSQRHEGETKSDCGIDENENSTIQTVVPRSCYPRCIHHQEVLPWMLENRLDTFQSRKHKLAMREREMEERQHDNLLMRGEPNRKAHFTRVWGESGTIDIHSRVVQPAGPTIHNEVNFRIITKIRKSVRLSGELQGCYCDGMLVVTGADTRWVRCVSWETYVEDVECISFSTIHS